MSILKSLIIEMGWEILIVLVSIFLYINAGSIPAPGRLPLQIGPDTWPRAILVILIICSLVRIFSIFKKSRISRPKESTERIVVEDEVSESVMEVVESRRNQKILIIAILLVFGFVLAIDVLGFPLGCLLFLWAFTYLGGWRKTIYSLLIPVLGTLFITFLFVKWVYIPLPKGRFFFESFTIAIYKALGIF